jgi:hypothetical protein
VKIKKGKKFNKNDANGNKKHISYQNPNVNKGGVEKPVNVNKLLKKEKNKYAKIQPEKLVESIGLFANKSNAQKFASKEFQTLATKQNASNNKQNKTTINDKNGKNKKNIKNNSNKNEPVKRKANSEKAKNNQVKNCV